MPRMDYRVEFLLLKGTEHIRSLRFNTTDKLDSGWIHVSICGFDGIREISPWSGTR